MSSIRRINASRANGARSRGPATPEGKQRSAANALRHGLLARTIVLEAESSEAFQEMVDDFIRRFQPADSIELSLVEEMAASVWRQRRCWAVETSMVDEAAARSSAEGPVAAIAAGYSALAEAPALPLIHRYETKANRAFQRALHNLLLLREMNLPNEPNPISEHQPDGCPETPGDPPSPVDPPAQPQPAEPESPNQPDPDSEPEPPTADPAPQPAPRSRLSDALALIDPLILPLDLDFSFRGPASGKGRR